MKIKELKRNLLRDKEIEKFYEDQKAEFDIARALIRARNLAHMTQEEVAKKMQTSQTHIARMESGHHFPTIKSLIKYATATQQAIDLHINPT